MRTNHTCAMRCQFPTESFKDPYSELYHSLVGDLQAEIDDIDDDIASMQKELRVSDTSDTSISEDRVSSPTTDQFLPDSPEF